MGKTLCNLSKDIEKDFSSYAERVKGARFVCARCGRAAAKKKNLCKPKKM